MQQILMNFYFKNEIQIEQNTKLMEINTLMREIQIEQSNKLMET